MCVMKKTRKEVFESIARIYHVQCVHTDRRDEECEPNEPWEGHVMECQAQR